MKPPKIALCLSGKIRWGYFCFPYIYNSFLNGRKNVQTFIHTWDDDDTIRLYNPKKSSIENNQEIVDDFFKKNPLDKGINPEGNVHNNLSMFHSIKKSFELVPKKYDIVIRCRFDLFLEGKIDLDKIVHDIMSDKYDIYIPQEAYNYSGYNDQIAIGSYKAMKIYSECIDNIKKISDNLKRWHPETFLKEHLDTNSLRVVQDGYYYRIVRNVIHG